MAEGPFEDIIARERLDGLEKRLARDESENIRKFSGFPQEYASRTEVELLRTALETIRADHVQRRELDERRRELDEVKAAQIQTAEDLRRRLAESAGRQGATRIATAVVATLLGVSFGALWKNQLTHADISQQIQTEAPWLQERPQIERELRTLESSEASQSQKIAAIQALDKFFCSSRVKVQLPGC